MEPNKSFICEDCKKSFTLKWNLKAHAKNCKGFGKQEMLTCEKCDGRFSLKRTLKVHIMNCFGVKTYSCKDCSETFAVYKHLHEHRQKFHTSSKCDYCDVVIANSKNLKRHIRLKHKGLTPSKAKELEMRENSKRVYVEKKDFMWEYCGKTFCDKSTLNRHSTSHAFPCNLCKKLFQSLSDLMSHMEIHETASKHASIIQGKKVVWADVIEEVKIIPVTKIPFNPNLSSKVMTMLDSLDKFMAIFGNRGESVRMEKFINMYEQGSKVRFQESVFRTIISIFPKSFKVELNKNVLNITFQGGAKPSDVKERKVVLKSLLNEIENENARYIDLVELPEIRRERYKYAKETILDNIITFDDDTSQDIKDSEADDLPGMFSSKFEELKEKIKRKNLIKKKREQNFKQIDLQLKRMNKLTNLVNKIFLSESRSSLKLEFLIEKIKQCEYSSSSIGDDLNRLITESKGWLKTWRGWVKRKSSVDVKDVMKLF